MSSDAVKRRSRVQLGIIVTIAVVCIGGSYLLFFYAQDGGVWGTTNRGEFVDPPLLADNLALRDYSSHLAEPVGFETGGVWWLWVAQPEECTVECDQSLHLLRQLQVLLNKDASRVRRALVTPTPLGDIQALSERFPKMHLLAGLAAMDLEVGIYVVDPIGNVILRYRLDQAGEPVLKDLKRLLKVSQIG